jgi:hypothetical protein
MFTSSSFDTNNNNNTDATSLLTSSYSHNSLQSAAATNQIWNEQKNLSKFSSKKETKNKSSIRQIFNKRSNNNNNNNNNNEPTSPPSSSPFKHSASSLNIAETVSKVADKAANLVDQSLSIISHNSATMPDSGALLEFIQCLNKLLSSQAPQSGAQTQLNTSYYDNNTVLNEFEDLFKTIFAQFYQDLSRQLRQFVDKFIEVFKQQQQQRSNKEKQQSDNVKQSDVVQEFFKKINKHITTSAHIKSQLERLNNVVLANTNESNQSEQQQQQQNGADELSEKLCEAIMIMVESFVVNSLYDYVFPSVMSEFEEQDMQLQKKIRSFYWITNEMIGTCIDENSIFYRESYEEALNYIVQMDSKRTPYEKMLCITECSKNIYKAINICASLIRTSNEAAALPQTPTDSSLATTSTTPSSSSSSSTSTTTNPEKKEKNLASADDYLPAFIYIVLKANPTMLYSNINFVTRFAFEKRILQGEHAYHFCSLNAIIAHIENMNAHHLSMTQEEFESYSNGLVDENSSAAVLKQIQTNLKILGELRDKQKLLKQETLNLQSDMISFTSSMEAKFHACLNESREKYTNGIEGFVRKSVLDDCQDVDLFNKSKMLLPLKPENAAAATASSKTDTGCENQGQEQKEI